MPFAVIGGHAVNAYGISRQTGDLDLIVRGSDKEAWSTLMKKMNYESGQHDERFARYRPDATPAWPIDLMFVDDETFRKILSDAVEMEFGPARARVVSSRHLVTLKIHALKHFQEHRFAKDFGDLVALLRSGKTGISDADLRELCVRYATSALYERIKEELPRS